MTEREAFWEWWDDWLGDRGKQIEFTKAACELAEGAFAAGRAVGRAERDKETRET